MHRSVLLVVSLSLLGIATHLLPHDPGVTTVGAVSMLSAAYLPKQLVPIPVLASVLIADVYVGGYSFVSMLVVYFAHFAAALAIIHLCKNKRVLGIAAAGVSNAIIFYLISNLSPVFSGYYPSTIEGFILCYINGLPFLLKGILANLVFGGIAFSAIYFTGRINQYQGKHVSPRARGTFGRHH